MAIKMRNKIVGTSLLFLEVALLVGLFMFLGPNAKAAIGNPDATVTTWLDVGNTYPDVFNVSIENSPITLTPNATTTVYCIAVVNDYNGEGDINSVNATFYDASFSSSGDTDDNNYHYTNSSCNITNNTQNFNGYTEDEYNALANCTFQVEYYANASTWECTVTVNDSIGWTGTNHNTGTISPLLALGVPDLINYSTVNATFVSDEQIANITNFGNVQINLSLEGYAVTQGDGLAMNCSQGVPGTIDIEHEKYNLTATTPGAVTLSQAGSFYTNLTSSSQVKRLELVSRTNDAVNDIYASSFWRIYVPRGVAGYCTGNIIFGATQANGS